MATHSSILGWGIPWQKSLEGYSLWGGHKRAGHNLATKQQQQTMILIATDRSYPLWNFILYWIITICILSCLTSFTYHYILIPIHVDAHIHSFLKKYLFVWQHWVLTGAYRITVMVHRLSSCRVQAVALKLAGSWFPHQGLNSHPSTGRWILNCWTTRESPIYSFIFTAVISWI